MECTVITPDTEFAFTLVQYTEVWWLFVLVQGQGVLTPPQPQPTAASAAGTAATAAAGAAAAIHRAGSSRGVRHLQQQQKLLQQQHVQNQLQHRQQQQQPPVQQQQQSAQQLELLQSMQQLHNAQQLLVQQPERCASSNLHSQVLLGKLPQQQQQQVVSLQQQQQQDANQEDFESLAFFLNTLHTHRASEAAAIRASVAEFDAQIAQVEATLQQLQQQQQPTGAQPPYPAAVAAAGAIGAGIERPPSAASGSTGENAAPGPQAAAACTVQQAQPPSPPPAAAGGCEQPDRKRGMQAHGSSNEQDSDDDEMERRERSRRHKRQRLAPAQQQQGPAATEQLQLLQRTGSTTSGLLQMQQDDAVAAVAKAAATAAAAGAAGVTPEMLSKWQHVSPKFDTLQTVYLQQKQAVQSQQQQGDPLAAARRSSGLGQRLSGFLEGFSDDLWGYSRYSRLAVRGTVRAAADLLGGGSAMVCAAAFDRDDEYIATAGVSKRIRIFEYDAITSGMCGAGGCVAGGRAAAACTRSSNSNLSGSDGGGYGSGGNGGTLGAAAADGSGVVYPVLELSSRSRLSCVAWSHYVKAQLASSDYEGVVQLWDANTGQELMQLEEHSKRAWAVDFSRLEPTRLVSSSDDGTVRLWSIHQEASVATLNLHANVCSVGFSPESPHLLAAGCANYRFYLYDLRNTAQPLVCVPGHRRSVSYVRWLDGQQLVTASTDNTLRRWSVPELLSAGSSSSSATREIGGAAAAAACRMTYRGHTNNRNFIGLSVLPGAPGTSPAAAGGSSSGGYIVCGSETNEAYVYHSSMPMPVASHSFRSLSQPWGGRWQQQGRRGSSSDLGALADLTDAAAGSKGDMFVSCVAWNRRQGTVVAANSAGHIQVLELA